MGGDRSESCESTRERVPGSHEQDGVRDESGPPGAGDALSGLEGISLASLAQVAGLVEAKPSALPPGCVEWRPTAADRDALLERNLKAFPSQALRTVRRIAQTPARRDVRFVTTPEGTIAALIETPQGAARQLASLRRPVEEARALVSGVKASETGAVAVLGFGVGHHVELLARAFGSTGIVLVFEPDVALLRSVLEHVDCTPWLALRNCVIVTDCEDSGEITASISGAEGMFMLGTRFVEHPASRARLGEAGETFARTLTGALRAVRTSIVTTLVQVDTTMRNLLGNLQTYAQTPGIRDLAGLYKGRPAIVVSAGPSLRRNVELLRDPAVRERFVIIAVQTVLKSLLAQGIKPHFVTALDHASISRRFYEGLSARDVEGITLIVEAKASPAILAAWPGEMRCPAEPILDSILGEHEDRGSLKPGATVAHLGYYLARHLGCDPVALIGQDLGFTDGQYYSAGAAIHQVWSGELNEFNTLEMLEWQRLVRSRSMLHKRTDHLGRPCYTDEQMATYLVQFERDFADDASRGLRVIDATEGGLQKRHAAIMPLRDVLTRYARESAGVAPVPRAETTDPEAIRRRLLERVSTVRADVWKVGEASRATAGLLRQILEHHQDQPRVNELIDRVQKHAAEVSALEPAYPLVQHLNQTGILNRFRADRAIELDASLTELERQRRQAERDLTNVTWLGDAADELGAMFDCLLQSLRRASERADRSEIAPPRSRRESTLPGGSAEQSTRTVRAYVVADCESSALGTPRDLGRPIAPGLNALQMTLARLSRSKRLSGVTVLTTRPQRVRELMGRAPAGLDVRIEAVSASDWHARENGRPGADPERAATTLRDLVRRGRQPAPACWRGGIGNVTVFDEVFDPIMLDAALQRGGEDEHPLLLGADWCLVDPSHVDALVDRFVSTAASGERHRMVFSHATPGLALAIVDRTLVREFAQPAAGPSLASLGTVLGYLPIAPQADPIARPACLIVEPEVRDAGLRLIADREDRCALLREICRELGPSWAEASASAVVAAARRVRPELWPVTVSVELVHRGADGEQVYLAAQALETRLAEARVRERGLIVSLEGNDALSHPGFVEMVKIARASGAAAVHVRTSLREDASVALLRQAAPDVTSIDLAADSAETYRRLTGRDQFAITRERATQLLEWRQAEGAGRWIVPRITRRDAVYAEIESFYDRWIILAGACVIDPLAESIPGERIEPLPVPSSAASRLSGERVRLLADGLWEHESTGLLSLFDARAETPGAESASEARTPPGSGAS